MKLIMWILGALPLAATAVLMNYLPDKVPMHFGLDGGVDRWGSKYELAAVSLIFLALPLIFQILLSFFEKKAKSGEEKDSIQAKSNIKVMSVLGISTLLFFDIVYGIFLGIITAMSEGETAVNIGFTGSIVCILMGILFIITGNFVPKTKKNGFLGLRTKWSMYNDDTWMKSNRFGGIVLIITGLAVIAAGALSPAPYAPAIMVGLLIAGTALSTVYSYKVYKDELNKGGQ